MTSLALLAPLLVALCLAVGASSLHRRVRPERSAMLLTGAIVAAAVAVVPTMVILSVGWVSHLPVVRSELDWCRVLFGLHATADPWVGGVATVLLVFGLVRVGRSVVAWRRHRCVEPGAAAVVDSDDWFAYSLPGKGGRVAVSSGLAGALDQRELEVVLAHERGHARHRHDRHLLAAEVAAGLVPPLGWLRRRLRFELERWADEEAVAATGGDRERVAFALAKVALGPTGSLGAVAGLSGLGVGARVEALLRPRSLRSEGWWGATILSVVLMVALAAGLQAHHGVEFLVTLCSR